MGSWHSFVFQPDQNEKPKLTTNKHGLKIIKDSEGLRLESYVCPGGKLTIGYGHTKKVHHKQVITQERAEELLIDDLKWVEGAIRDLVVVPINENEFSALASFVYNIGRLKFQKSTMLRLLNDGNRNQAASELNKWVWAGGKKLAGLIVRRQKEKELFLIQPVVRE